MKKRRGEAPAINGATNSHAYQQALIEKRREVMDGLGMKFDLVATMGRVGEEDQAQLSHDEFIHLQRNQHNWNVLKLVDAALDRLQTGEYGVCQRCEDQIAPRRLQVIPWAMYCVSCQERLSQRHFEEEPALAAW